MKFKIAVALAAFIALWLGHREYQIHTTPPKIRPTFTAEQEAAAEKALLATPESDEAAFLKAAGAYSEIPPARLLNEFPPYWERMPWQLHSANRELLHTGNIFRYVRWVRHAVFPWLDRPA